MPILSWLLFLELMMMVESLSKRFVQCQSSIVVVVVVAVVRRVVLRILLADMVVA